MKKYTPLRQTYAWIGFLTLLAIVPATILYTTQQTVTTKSYCEQHKTPQARQQGVAGFTRPYYPEEAPCAPDGHYCYIDINSK